MGISKELLDILACPDCIGKVSLTEQQDGLVCSKCGLVYPLRDGVPVMLKEKAVRIKQ